MNVSVSLRNGHPADDPRATAQHLIARARPAANANLDVLFVGDHHGVADAHYLQNTPLLGRLLAEVGDRTHDSMSHEEYTPTSAHPCSPPPPPRSHTRRH